MYLALLMEAGGLVTLLEIMMISVGGFLGAVVRYQCSIKLNVGSNFPLGTLSVNLVGASLIGIVFALDIPRMWTFILVSGLAGSLTTFSTLHKELIELWRAGNKRMAFLYVLVTYVGGIMLCAAWYLLLK